MDLEAQEQASENDTGSDAAFLAGLNGTESEQTETPAARGDEATGQQAAEEQAATLEPKYVQITEEQWNDLTQRAAKIDEIEGRTKQGLDKAFGSIGGVTQQLNELRNGGSGIDLSADGFKNLRELGFEDVAEAISKDLNAALGKRGSAAPAAAPAASQPAAPDMSEFETRVAAQIAEAREQAVRETNTEMLTAAHPDWLAVRETPEFQAMVRAKPAAWQEEFWNTTKASVVINAFNEFKQSRRAAPAPRQNRFAAAETPRGTGGHLPAPLSKDPFLQGLEEG